MMRSVWFPIQAGRAPNRATICLTDKCIPAVEVLQARRWLRSRRRCRYLARITVAREASVLRALPASVSRSTSIGALAGSFPVTLTLLFCFTHLQSVPLAAAWNVSGIYGNGIKEPGVGDDKEGEKDRVYYKDANRWARTASMEGVGRPEEVVHCLCSLAWNRQRISRSLTA